MEYVCKASSIIGSPCMMCYCDRSSGGSWIQYAMQQVAGREDRASIGVHAIDEDVLSQTLSGLRGSDKGKLEAYVAASVRYQRCHLPSSALVEGDDGDGQDGERDHRCIWCHDTYPSQRHHLFECPHFLHVREKHDSKGWPEWMTENCLPQLRDNVFQEQRRQDRLCHQALEALRGVLHARPRVSMGIEENYIFTDASGMTVACP